MGLPRRGTSPRILSLAATAAIAAGALTVVWAGPMAEPALAGTTGPDAGQIVAFGSDASHQIDGPGAAAGAIAISASSELAMALTWDGKVIAWGDDEYGQTDVPAWLPKVKAIASGGDFAAALTTAGQVVAWGSDQAHQTEVPVAAQSGVVFIAAGADCVIALKSDGSIVTWGDNTYGQRNVPLVPKMIGTKILLVPLTNLKSVSVSDHVIGIQSDGSVIAWGNNNHGQATVPAGLSGVTAVSAGYDFSLALRSDGTIAAWGNNASGQLNVPCIKLLPTGNCITPSGFSAIAAGNTHAIAIQNGHLVTWGGNAYGQTAVPDNWKGITGLVSVAAGSDFSMALWGIPSAPGQPVAVSAIAGYGTAQVTWDGMAITGWGAPITYFRATSSPGGKACLVAPTDQNWQHCVVTGLTNGTTYTFTVTATNGLGTSVPSDPSNAVTPHP